MNKFSEVMAERTDRQLAEILLVKRDEYQPEALEAAEEEMKKRNLDPTTLFVENEVEYLREADSIERAEKKLEWYHKVLIVLLPAIISIGISYVFRFFPELRSISFLPLAALLGTYYLIHHSLKSSGHVTIAKEFKNWLVYSVYIYIGIGVIAILLVIVLMMTGSFK